MSTAIPQTEVAVSYAYQIQVDGKTIGTLQGFSISMNKDITRARGVFDWGTTDTVELIPGHTEVVIQVEKFEVYIKTLLDHFLVPSSSDVQSSLQNIGLPLFNESFNIVESVFSPSGAVRVITYRDCLVRSYTKAIKEGTITVIENAAIQCGAVLIQQF